MYIIGYWSVLGTLVPGSWSWHLFYVTTRSGIGLRLAHMFLVIAYILLYHASHPFTMLKLHWLEGENSAESSWTEILSGQKFCLEFFYRKSFFFS